MSLLRVGTRRDSDEPQIDGLHPFVSIAEIGNNHQGDVEKCASGLSGNSNVPRSKLMRGPLTFKQRDLTRALKAVKAAGHVPARAEIDKNGKIIVILSDDKPASSSSWDDAINDR